jgi:uncharacterized membrane protein
MDPQVSEWTQAVLRWAHVVAGVMWIGHLWFFNFVNGPFAATLDKDTKPKVVPELMPRALFWFRWGAAWTWITGALLLGVVFHSHPLDMFGAGGQWGPGAGAMVTLVLVSPFIYDVLANSGLGKNNKAFAWVALVLVGVLIWAYVHVGGMTYRATNIHIGALFGTIMAFNVWFRIWPNQRKIITAVKSGQAPDAALVSLAGARSRHNTYMSVPLIWTMINQHTTVAAGIGGGTYPGVALLGATALGWLVVMILYKKAAGQAPKGF